MAQAEKESLSAVFSITLGGIDVPFALNAQRWQYFLPCSVFVLHVSQELE
jgi:hypothetical protein